MVDPLASARVKLRRANLHAATAKRESGRFFKSQPAPTFEGDFERETCKLGAKGRILLRLARDVPDPPESFSARFGDAIHNYRCALDHVAWQLVLHGSIPEPKEPWKVQFPICDSRTQFRKKLAQRLPGVDGTAQRFIETRQPDDRGNPSDNPLVDLASLSNDDKHRTIHVIVTTLADIETNFTLTDFEVTGLIGLPGSPRLKKGVVVAGALGIITGPNPKAEVLVKPTGYIALEDGRDIDDVLHAIRTEVEEIISAPEIAAALA
jgi:hypothetical protein